MKIRIAGGMMALCFVLPALAIAVEGPIETLKAKNAEKLESACQTELETYCSHVTPGNKRGLACLYAHSDKLSNACEAAFYETSEELRHATANLNAFTSACRGDMEKLCSKVAIGEGRILECLEKNQDKVSADCNEMRLQAEGDLGQSKDIDYQYHTAKIQ
jgi:Cysteine rich repeat